MAIRNVLNNNINVLRDSNGNRLHSLRKTDNAAWLGDPYDTIWPCGQVYRRSNRSLNMFVGSLLNDQVYNGADTTTSLAAYKPLFSAFLNNWGVGPFDPFTNYNPNENEGFFGTRMNDSNGNVIGSPCNLAGKQFYVSPSATTFRNIFSATSGYQLLGYGVSSVPPDDQGMAQNNPTQARGGYSITNQWLSNQGYPYRNRFAINYDGNIALSVADNSGNFTNYPNWMYFSIVMMVSQPPNISWAQTPFTYSTPSNNGNVDTNFKFGSWQQDPNNQNVGYIDNLNNSVTYIQFGIPCDGSYNKMDTGSVSRIWDTYNANMGITPFFFPMLFMTSNAPSWAWNASQLTISSIGNTDFMWNISGSRS